MLHVRVYLCHGGYFKGQSKPVLFRNISLFIFLLYCSLKQYEPILLIKVQIKSKFIVLGSNWLIINNLSIFGVCDDIDCKNLRTNQHHFGLGGICKLGDTPGFQPIQVLL